MKLKGKIAFCLKHPLTLSKYLIKRDINIVITDILLDKSKEAEPKPSILTELANYLKLPERIVATNLAKGPKLTADRWTQENPQTHQEIRNFYQHCSEYLYELTQWNMNPEYQRRLALLDNERNGTCLNFGGGIGSEMLKLAAQGNRVFYIDIPGSPVWKFAQWRAQQRSIAVEFVEDIPENIRFDSAIAFDVFEHLQAEDLKIVLGKIAAALKPNGRLYCVNEFEAGSVDRPMHYDNAELWDGLIKELLLTKVNKNLYVKPPD